MPSRDFLLVQNYALEYNKYPFRPLILTSFSFRNYILIPLESLNFNFEVQIRSIKFLNCLILLVEANDMKTNKVFVYLTACWPFSIVSFQTTLIQNLARISLGLTIREHSNFLMVKRTFDVLAIHLSKMPSSSIES